MTARLFGSFRAAFVAVGVCLIVPGSLYAQSETVEYYGLDSLGSVRIVFAPSGTVSGRVDFGPFGDELSPALSDPKSYAQLVRDGDAGFDYAEARMYQPRTGRFSSTDPALPGLLNPQRWNRYAYVSNAPLGAVDPAGRTELAVTCGAGAQWCPGNIKVGPDQWINVDGQFNAASYGYHGGEPSAALAAWGQTRDSRFLAAAGFGQPGGVPTPTIRECPYWQRCAAITNHYKDGQYKPEKADYDPKVEGSNPWMSFPNHTRVEGVDGALFDDTIYKVSNHVQVTIFGDGLMSLNAELWMVPLPPSGVPYFFNPNSVANQVGLRITGREGTGPQNYHEFIRNSWTWTDPNHTHIRR